jgi:hypothetical protein
VENLSTTRSRTSWSQKKLSVSDLIRANATRLAWCNEANTVIRSEIRAIPDDRLIKERWGHGTVPSLRTQIGKLVMRKVDRRTVASDQPASRCLTRTSAAMSS